MKKTLLLLTFLMITVSGSSAFAFLKASGQQIVDANGTSILLRGYGLGGWLVPEGYMLQTPGYGSPTDIYNKIVDVIGEANAATFYAAYRENYVNRKDIEQIAEWGFNSIRMPFHYNLFYDIDSDTFLESGFVLLDSLLDQCADNNMYVILDMHCAPGGQNDSNISDSDGTARLWTEASIYQPITVKIWQEIARRYFDDPRIGGYDLINEPVLPNGFTNLDLRNLYIEITDSIRVYDQNHLILVEGNWYATNFDQLTPPWDSNMGYSFHKYWSETDQGSISAYTAIRSQHNVPLWMGESGENSNTWFYEAIKLFESNNIGWNWWTHKKLDTITSPFSAKRPDGYQALLNYWSGSGAKPSQSAALATLMQLAENLKIENCEYRPGVIPALTDPEFGTVSKPFKAHTIPGQIYAVDYDFGSQGIGYVDTEYRNISGSIWNNGYGYRNDGVDIELSQDNLGFDYNVGWMESGERLIYTVEVAASGIYQGHFRVANNGTNGLISIVANNVPLTAPIAVPNTNGWQNWQTMVIDDLEFTAGTNKLMILVNRSGLNLNSMTFFLIAVGIEDDENSAVPEKFNLEQNYPNPFNPATNIYYEISKSTTVKLTVYNALGQEVQVLKNAVQPAGRYTVVLNAEQLQSGVYFYQLQTPEFTQTRKMMLLK